MRPSSPLMLAFLLGSACVDEPVLVSESRTLGDDARATVIDEEMATAPEPDICDLLPECGVCSVACDWEALREYVPLGTCAAFVCELVDGRELTFHACHPDN